MAIRYRRLGLRNLGNVRIITGHRYHFVYTNPRGEVKNISTLDPYWGQMYEKLKYSPIESLSPQSRNKFRDVIYSRFHEEATPENLGISFPYPEYFENTDGIWKRFDYATNNDFLQNVKRDRTAHFTTDKGNTFTPFWKDKDAGKSRPGTVREGYTMSSAWKEYKARGIL